VAFTLWWPIGLIGGVLWIGVTALSRTSSAGGLAAANGAPLVAHLLGQATWLTSSSPPPC
jgi:hypothetical protein